MVFCPENNRMNKYGFILILFFFLPVIHADSQDSISHISDSLLFRGQISTWVHYNGSNALPLWLGERYIPELGYTVNFTRDRLIDFEFSANQFVNAGIHLSDSVHSEANIKPYRAWARFSTKQLEIRAGLQKINFGSASILRPLMWFDRIDPRDPLQLTDGVWGLLGRYYFLNNANIWIWGLYGNKNRKGWETIKTNREVPEFGGRFQFPVSKGEAGFSYHYRTADSRNVDSLIPAYAKIPENRLGFDIRIDWFIGCWAEVSWSQKSKNLGALTNQEFINLGMDYTFGIGNGIYTVFEQLLVSADEKAWAFGNTTTFSLLSVSYPIGLFDNLGAIVYFDWTNNKAYNFFNWQKQLNNLTFYVMGYWNPEDYYIPSQGAEQTLFAGRGIQVMLVYNH